MNFLTCNHESVRTAFLTRHIHDESSQTNDSHNGKDEITKKTKPSLCFLWLPSFINSLTFFVSQHNFGAALVALLLFIYYSMSADAAPAPN